MHEIIGLKERIRELEGLLEISERKADILTNLLKEANAEFEKALELVTRSEANFRAVFENAPEAIYVIDTDSRQILDCNPFLVQWLGYTRDELLSMRLDDLIAANSGEVLENIRRAVEHGLVRVQERRYVKKDCTIVDAEVTGTVLAYQGKRCVAILLRDVTERKQVQEALRKSEERFRDIANRIPDWIWEVDENWVYTYSNQSVERILGFRPGEIVGKFIWDRMFSEEREDLFEKLKAIQQSPRPFSLLESRRIHRDGRIVHLESSEVPLLDDSGRLYGYRGVHRDVTERKRLEELSRYKELFENVSDPVFINDFKGYFLEVNEGACRLFNYSRDQLLMKRLQELVPIDQMRLVSEAAKHIGKGEPVQFELELVTDRGDLLPFELHSRSIVFRGKQAVLSVARDLSIRKRLEDTLVRTERLAAVGEMAGGVAHNFNNLLQSIMGSAQAARFKLDSGQVGKAQDAIEVILRACDRGADVVRRIKDFTDAGHHEMDHARHFDLAGIVQEALELTEPLWKVPLASKNYRFRFDEDPDTYVKGKPSEISEVIVNIIRNAFEAMPEGGLLAVSTYCENDKVCLEISDTGPGIPKESLQRIFEPFYTTKGLRNSGLGLSSSYGIVRKHQGEIRVDSLVGNGTTFTIELPAVRVRDEIKSPDTVISKPSRIRFLVIDDEVNVTRAMEMFFEGTQVEIMAVQSGAEGLRAVRKGNYDVVLCDLSMDDMDGWEVGENIKQYCHDTGTPKIPFFIYTGWDKRVEPGQLVKSGVDRVITKPIPYDQLLRIVQEVCSERGTDPAPPPSPES
jgi:PAS domain S-box-containing protein